MMDCLPLIYAPSCLIFVLARNLSLSLTACHISMPLSMMPIKNTFNVLPAISHMVSLTNIFFFTMCICAETSHYILCLNRQRLLVSYIEERLRSLEEMRVPLQAEVEENAAHGEALAVLVRERCLPVELERYNLFIGDLERVVSLLLCLSARLARVQNTLSTVDQHTDAEEKVSVSVCLSLEISGFINKRLEVLEQVHLTSV